MRTEPPGPPEPNPYEPPRARTIRARSAGLVAGSALKQALDLLAIGVAGLVAAVVTAAAIFATGTPRAPSPPIIRWGGPAGAAILTGWGVARWLGRPRRRRARRGG